MTPYEVYGVLYGRNDQGVVDRNIVEDVKEINPGTIGNHIAEGYRIISKEEAERLRTQAKGLVSLTE